MCVGCNFIVENSNLAKKLKFFFNFGQNTKKSINKFLLDLFYLCSLIILPIYEFSQQKDSHRQSANTLNTLSHERSPKGLALGDYQIQVTRSFKPLSN